MARTTRANISRRIIGGVLIAAFFVSIVVTTAEARRVRNSVRGAAIGAGVGALMDGGRGAQQGAAVGAVIGAVR